MLSLLVLDIDGYITKVGIRIVLNPFLDKTNPPAYIVEVDR
jgi:hypothetical protein